MGGDEVVLDNGVSLQLKSLTPTSMHLLAPKGKKSQYCKEMGKPEMESEDSLKLTTLPMI